MRNPSGATTRSIRRSVCGDDRRRPESITSPPRSIHTRPSPFTITSVTAVSLSNCSSGPSPPAAESTSVTASACIRSPRSGAAVRTASVTTPASTVAPRAACAITDA